LDVNETNLEDNWPLKRGDFISLAAEARKCGLLAGMG